MLSTPITRIYHKFAQQTELIISQKLRSAIYKLKYFIHFFPFFTLSGWRFRKKNCLKSISIPWYHNDMAMTSTNTTFSPFLLKRISPGKLLVKKKRGCRSQNRSESYIQNRVTNVTKKEKKEDIVSINNFVMFLFRLQLFCSFYTKIPEFFWLA